MGKVCIVFAHPRLENSVVNRTLIKAVERMENVEIRDLYELYPDYNIRVSVEKEALLSADTLIWHHPVYWYSCPPLLKQWIDLVLQHGWAYGKGGDKLKGKRALNVVSSGGSTEAYSPEGFHGHTIQDFFLPFKQTAWLCGMHYLPPFVVYGSHRIQTEQLQEHARNYHTLVRYLTENTPELDWKVENWEHIVKTGQLK